MSDHFPALEVEEALEYIRSPERLRELIAHLLRGCEICRGSVRYCLSQTERSPQRISKESHAYDAVLDRAADFARRLVSLPDRERHLFKKATSLLSTGRGVVAITVEGDLPLAGLGMLEALLSRSWAARHSNPQEMWHLANAATKVADHLAPEEYGPLQVFDFRARAWAELANAYRVTDHLQEAKETFEVALSYLLKGTGDPLLQARLLELHASLLGTLRELPLALKCFSVVPGLYRERGDQHLTGRALITKALYVFYNGGVQEAIRLNSAGLSLVDANREPGLIPGAVQNHLLYLAEMGEFRRAKKFLFEYRPQLLNVGRVTAIKLRGIEGRIDYGLGSYANAEAAFREAKEGFLSVGLAFAGALAGLDLALTLLHRGSEEEAEIEIIEALKVLVSLDIQSEILGAVVLLEQVFRLKAVDVVFMEDAMKVIRKIAIELGLG